MRKLISILAFILVFTLTGCYSKNENLMNYSIDGDDYQIETDTFELHYPLYELDNKYVLKYVEIHSSEDEEYKGFQIFLTGLFDVDGIPTLISYYYRNDYEYSVDLKYRTWSDKVNSRGSGLENIFAESDCEIVGYSSNHYDLKLNILVDGEMHQFETMSFYGGPLEYDYDSNLYIQEEHNGYTLSYDEWDEFCSEVDLSDIERVNDCIINHARNTADEIGVIDVHSSISINTSEDSFYNFELLINEEGLVSIKRSIKDDITHSTCKDGRPVVGEVGDCVTD